MPLFGHKNKHAAPTAHSGLTNTDPARNQQQNDFATDSSRTSNLDHTAQPSNTGGAGLSDPNNFGAQGAPAGSGIGTHHGATTHHHAGQASLGSAALREQGMLRDREAQNLHAQSEELAEAERLEQQAREHRERAVAQGAHPMNKHLAGGNLTHNTAGFEHSQGTGPSY